MTTKKEFMDKVVLKKNPHAEMVMEWWKASGIASMELTEKYLKGELDPDTLATLISIYRRLYVELYPKIVGRGEIEKDFKKLKDFIMNPDKIIDQPNLIFELEFILRNALELVGYTDIEKIEPLG